MPRKPRVPRRRRRRSDHTTARPVVQAPVPHRHQESAELPGLRIVGYVRVSTDEQNPDLQRRALEGYAATKGVPLLHS